jgi:hypothetical protein
MFNNFYGNQILGESKFGAKQFNVIPILEEVQIKRYLSIILL